MRTPATEVQQARTGAGTAFVLADPEVWSPALHSALKALGLTVTSCPALLDLFDACRSDPATLLVLAQDNARFAVRACRAMRGLQDLPILAVIPRDSDLIPVLDAGADDCVVARTDPEVVAARVRALLRRARNPSRTGGLIIVRDLILDMDKCQVFLRDRPVALTPTEFRILAVLAERAGKVIDAQTLLSAAHEHTYEERDAQNLVKVHIANLRRKLEDSRTNNPYIFCARGFGYMLERRSQRREDDILASLLDPDNVNQTKTPS